MPALIIGLFPLTMRLIRAADAATVAQDSAMLQRAEKALVTVTRRAVEQEARIDLYEAKRGPIPLDVDWNALRAGVRKPLA